MTKEIWKMIPGMKYQYLVSNNGNVIALPSCQRHCTRLLKLKHEKSGYVRVSLETEEGRKTFPVHRLVAAAFLPNPLGLPQVNHKDEDKSNNCVDNLEWCTAKYNSNYGTRIARMVAKQWNTNHARPVRQLTKNGDVVAVYPSTAEIPRASSGKFKRANVCHCLAGETDFAYGYKWEYVA